MEPRLRRVAGAALAAMLALGAACGASASRAGAGAGAGTGGAAEPTMLSGASGQAGTAVGGVGQAGGAEGGAAGSDVDEIEETGPGHGVTLGRVTHSLDGEWLFATADSAQGEAAGYFEPDFDDSGWAPMAVPGSWNLHDAFAEHEGVGWYRRTFETPPDLQGVARLHFEAAYYEAQVWLNGKLLGSHRGGYTPFEF